jgi:hypothetical protein
MNINDIVTESQQACPHCGGPLVEYSGLMEKKDACYYKVKASAKVWPSAYASGRLVQCRKKGAGNYGNKSEGVAEGLSKRDQQDVAAIKAAIERLESQLNHPNADKAAIQQSIAHERKRLALYGQGMAEGQDNPYGYRKGQTVKLDNGTQGRVIDIFDDSIEVLLVGGRTVTVDFRDAQVISEQQSQKVFKK